MLKYILRHSPPPGSESEEDGRLGLTPKTPWEHWNSEENSEINLVLFITKNVMEDMDKEPKVNYNTW